MNLYFPRIFEADAFKAVITVLQSDAPNARPRPLTGAVAVVFVQSGGVETQGTATIVNPAATENDPDCGQVAIQIPAGTFVAYLGKVQLRITQNSEPRTVWDVSFKVHPSFGIAPPANPPITASASFVVPFALTATAVIGSGGSITASAILTVPLSLSGAASVTPQAAASLTVPVGLAAAAQMQVAAAASLTVPVGLVSAARAQIVAAAALTVPVSLSGSAAAAVQAAAGLTVPVSLSGSAAAAVQAAAGLTLPVSLSGSAATATGVPVMVWAGQSQIGGARSVKSDITGYVGLATDADAFIWDCPSQTIVTLVPGSAELQPSLALMDPAFTDTVGPLGEFNRFFRRDNPSTPIYHFKYAVGGSRFTNAGTLGVSGNWASGVSGGAREAMLANWTAFVAALAAQGKYPVVTWMATDLGYSSGTDSTESTNYQADMTALIGWWRTNIIGATARLTIARACGTITGFTFLSAIRTAQANIRTAAPTLVELMDTDDFELVTIDTVHFTAASHMHQGERLYCHYANRWYPAVDRVNGATLFPTDSYRLGDLRNTYVGALKTGNISDLWDGIRGRTSPITFTQATDSNRPAINTETLGGLSVRNGRFNGTTSRMQRNTGRMAGATPWGLCYALRVATPAGPAAPIGEGLSSSANPFVSLRVDVDTFMEAFMRDTTGGVVTGPFDYATANAAGDVMRAFSLSYDGTNIQGQTDATLGGSNAFPLSGITASDRVSFGCVIYGGGSLHFADTDIAEVWWTNGALDATYRAKARSYMQWRWGTP